MRVPLAAIGGKDPPARTRVALERLDEIITHFDLPLFPGLGCESFFRLCGYPQDLLLEFQIVPSQVAELLLAKSSVQESEEQDLFTAA